MKLLLIEDDPLINSDLQRLMRHWGYICDLAVDGRIGLEMMDATCYDLVVIDVNLPVLDGFAVARKIREKRNRYQPFILMLTARGEKQDQLTGLDSGADDYLVKPFDLDILRMRIRALLRRQDKSLVQEGHSWGDLDVNTELMKASFKGNSLSLTPKEILILEALIRANGQACSKPSLIDAAWHLEEAPSEENIRTHLKNMRMKLSRAGAPTDMIETVYGVGLRMNEAYR
jgi:DNA-binding response OmpR family regulator